MKYIVTLLLLVLCMGCEEQTVRKAGPAPSAAPVDELTPMCQTMAKRLGSECTEKKWGEREDGVTRILDVKTQDGSISVTIYAFKDKSSGAEYLRFLEGAGDVTRAFPDKLVQKNWWSDDHKVLLHGLLEKKNKDHWDQWALVTNEFKNL